MTIQQKAMSSHSMEGGFTDPVFQSQSVFNGIMNAMARPGTISTISPAVSAPAPANVATASILLTLCDADTKVWLDDACCKNDFLTDWLSFQSGAMLTDEYADCDFAVISDIGLMPDLAEFTQGNQEYPDRSTTLIVQVDSVQTGMPLILKGPGIKQEATLTVSPMPELFIDQWRANGERFPCGVDIIFAAPDALVCLPRTSKILSEGALCM